MKIKTIASRRKLKHFKKVLLIVLSISTCLEFSGCYLFPKEKEVIAPPLVKPVEVAYDTVDVAKGDIKIEVNCSGNFAYVQQQDISFPDRGGRLKKVYVKVTDEVKAGQLLAELDTDDLVSEIEQQKIVLKKAQTSCQSTSANGNNDIKLAQLNLDNLKSQYVNMTAKPSDSDSIGVNDIFSQKDIDAVKKQIEEQQINLEKLKAQYGENGYAIKQAKQDVEMQELKLKELETRLKKSKLISPVNGVIMNIDSTIDPGDNITMNIPYMTIADKSKLQLMITDIDNVPKFEFGMRVNVSDTYGNDYIGKVVKTPAVMTTDEKLRAGEDGNRVQIEVPGLKPDVQAGDTASINVVLQEKKDVIVISKDVVHDYNGDKVVDVLENDHKKERIIEIGMETDAEYEVIKGLNVGDKVIK